MRSKSEVWNSADIMMVHSDFDVSTSDSTGNNYILIVENISVDHVVLHKPRMSMI